MNITILARSPPASFFLCPKSSNKQGEELMNDIFENTETMQENEHAGQIHMNWDCRRRLALIPGVDSFSRLPSPKEKAGDAR